MNQIEQLKQNTENSVKAATNKYKKEVQAVENSLDPRYKDARFKQATLDDLKADLDEEVTHLRAQHEREKDAILVEAKETAGKAQYKPTSSETQKAEELLGEFQTQLTLATSTREKGVAQRELSDKLAELERGELLAVKQRFPALVQAISGDKEAVNKARVVHHTLSDVKTEEREAFDELAQSASVETGDPFRGYTTLKATHPTFNGKKQASNYEGMSYIDPTK
ncbi:hypothetical protein [Salimicrobium humidisoli]|uniref:Phage minor structural protein GP20 n=1 Tax=Salimicrobium humidisoli TaxID=2029857 RepID=A0ABX4HRB0_9BACI|nr:hypothetical protein [Salimicrobium humidisoli]PBB05734.1 hypothetical protein CKW00_06965 [Salimicrobium humidisoli]